MDTNYDKHVHDNRTMLKNAKFGLGQLVVHRLFDYRGVVVDIDPVYLGTEGWYRSVAFTRPPKDEPWYRVLVDNALHETYVAERNLSPDSSGAVINHPHIDAYFDDFDDGCYTNSARRNH